MMMRMGMAGVVEVLLVLVRGHGRHRHAVVNLHCIDIGAMGVVWVGLSLSVAIVLPVLVDLEALASIPHHLVGFGFSPMVLLAAGYRRRDCGCCAVVVVGGVAMCSELRGQLVFVNPPIRPARRRRLCYSAWTASGLHLLGAQEIVEGR